MKRCIATPTTPSGIANRTLPTDNVLPCVYAYLNIYMNVLYRAEEDKGDIIEEGRKVPKEECGGRRRDRSQRQCPCPLHLSNPRWEVCPTIQFSENKYISEMQNDTAW